MCSRKWAILLIVLFHQRPDFDYQLQVGSILGLSVLSNEIGESIFESSYLDIGIKGKLLVQLPTQG